MPTQQTTIGHEDTREAARILRTAQIDEEARHVEDDAGRFRHGSHSPAALTTRASALQAAFALAIAALSRMPDSEGDPIIHLEDLLPSVPACRDQMGRDMIYYS